MGQGMEDAKAMLRYLMNKRQIEQAQEQKAFIEGGGRLGDGTETPIPGAASMKRKVDESLTANVVEPMAARGYGDLGAAIATVPSVIADVVLPDTVGELAMPPPVRGGGKVIDLAARRAEKAGGKEASAMAKRATPEAKDMAPGDVLKAVKAGKVSLDDVKRDYDLIAGPLDGASRKQFDAGLAELEKAQAAATQAEGKRIIAGFPEGEVVPGKPGEASAMTRRTKLTPEEMAAQRKAGLAQDAMERNAFQAKAKQEMRDADAAYDRIQKEVNGGKAFTGEELAGMSDAELDAAVLTVRLKYYSTPPATGREEAYRTTVGNKNRIIEELRRRFGKEQADTYSRHFQGEDTMKPPRS